MKCLLFLLMLPGCTGRPCVEEIVEVSSGRAESPRVQGTAPKDMPIPELLDTYFGDRHSLGGSRSVDGAYAPSVKVRYDEQKGTVTRSYIDVEGREVKEVWRVTGAL